MCRGLQLLVLDKKKMFCGVASGDNLLKFKRKNKFKMFKKAVSKIFIVTLHKKTIKHLQEVDSVVNSLGAEVFLAFQIIFPDFGLLWSKISTPAEV